MTFEEWWEAPKTVAQICASPKNIAQQAYQAGADSVDRDGLLSSKSQGSNRRSREMTYKLPDWMPEWATHDDLGGRVPSQVRQAISQAYQAGADSVDRTTGEPCWCNPETTYKDPNTGASVIVHKEPQ